MLFRFRTVIIVKVLNVEMPLLMNPWTVDGIHLQRSFCSE
jgi:hypothetical protein